MKKLNSTPFYLQEITNNEIKNINGGCWSFSHAVDLWKKQVLSPANYLAYLSKEIDAAPLDSARENCLLKQYETFILGSQTI